jgi:hypothetical protein
MWLRIRIRGSGASLIMAKNDIVEVYEKTSKKNAVGTVNPIEKTCERAVQDQCCESALVSMRIRIKHFTSTQIRIRGAKPMRIHMHNTGQDLLLFFIVNSSCQGQESMLDPG